MTAGGLVVTAVVGVLVYFAALLVLQARSSGRVLRRLRHHVPAEEKRRREHAFRRARVLLDRLFAATERALGGTRPWKRLAALLERADVGLAAAHFFYVMVGTGLGLGFLFALAGLPAAVVVLSAPLGAAAPLAWLVRKAGRRRRAFDEQLPDLLMTMAASVRVGHTFRQSMQAVVSEGQEPASKEFGHVLLETDLGRPLDRALAEMARRLGSANFDYVINVVTIQREVGGSLASLFDLVAQTVRQRQQFAKKVRGLTAMGRLSAYVLTGLPFVVVGGMTLINPGYMRPLFTTSTGQLLIAVSLAGIAIGALLLRKIVAFRMA